MPGSRNPDVAKAKGNRKLERNCWKAGKLVFWRVSWTNGVDELSVERRLPR